MALKIVKGRFSPIGVDLGTTAAKLIQLHFGEDDTVELAAAGLVPIPPEFRQTRRKSLDWKARQLRELLLADEFKGRQCILSLPAEATVVQHIKIPKLSPEEIPGAVLGELQGKLPFDVDKAIVRHVIAGDVYVEGEAKQEVIAFAVARSTLNAYLSMARKAKLDVIGVNVEPCAVVECFARLFRRPSDAGRTILYLDVGAASTQVVLSQGPRIAFARNLAIGGHTLDKAVAEGLRISLEEAHRIRQEVTGMAAAAAPTPAEAVPAALQMTAGQVPEDAPAPSEPTGASAEGAATDPALSEQVYRLLLRPLDALADELTQCLRYFESAFRNQNIERTIFLGGVAHDKRICQAIAQRLNVPAQIGDPLVRIKRSGDIGLAAGLDRRQPQPNWAVAVGLCLGAGQAA